MNVEKSIDAVTGYLQLEMPVEAIEELEEIASAAGEDERYLELLLAAQMMDKRWNKAVESAQQLCKLSPKRKSFFIHAAFCLHETGDTLAAKRALLAGPRTLAQDALYHYNMGCYDAILGNVGEARSHLERAFELDDSLRETAKEDEDLVGVEL